MKLIIVIDLDQFPMPDESELKEAGDLLSYLVDYFLEDPVSLLDEASWSLHDG